jgi:hypothetical protein
MSEAMMELLFWTFVFVGLFFLFRYLQKRKKDKDGE